MRFFATPVDASQIAGGLAFALAAAACVAAFSARSASARAAGEHRRANVWLALAALHCAFALEVVVGLRYRLHAFADAHLQARGWYASRGGWQIAMIVLLLGAVAAVGQWVERRLRHDAALTGASLATLAAATLFALETISLHEVDTLMYAKAGPIVCIAWMWLAVTGVVFVSALLAWQRVRQRTTTRSGKPRARR